MDSNTASRSEQNKLTINYNQKSKVNRKKHFISKQQDNEQNFQQNRSVSNLDDISDVSEEEFSSISYYSDVNDDQCFYCTNEGSIICCDNCNKGFHKKCLSQQNIQIPIKDQPFLCPVCNPIQQNKCNQCQYKLQNQALKITCSLCCEIFHSSCVNLNLEFILDSYLNKKFFINEEISNVLFEIKQFYHQCNNQNENQINLHDSTKLIQLQGKLKKLAVEQNLDKQIFHICEKCQNRNKVKQIFTFLEIQTEIQGENKDEFNKIFFIQFQNYSYIHSIWVGQKFLEETSKIKLKNVLQIFNEQFQPISNDDKKFNGFIDEIIFNKDCLKIDRILTIKIPVLEQKRANPLQQYYQRLINKDLQQLYFKNTQYGGTNNFKFLIKWQGHQYDESTFEDELVVSKNIDKIIKYLMRKLKIEEQIQWNPHNYDSEDLKTPDYIQGGQLHNFQIQGMNFMIKSWLNKTNVILADQMGLGKTIQTISFLNYIYYEQNIKKPILIIAPNSTILNWNNEIQKWAPQFNCINYIGNQVKQILKQLKLQSPLQAQIQYFYQLFQQYISLNVFAKIQIYQQANQSDKQTDQIKHMYILRY